MEFAFTQFLPLAAAGPSPVEVGGMNSLQLIMLIAAIGGLTILMLSTRRKFRTRAANPGATARERYADLDRHTKARRDTQEVIIELDRVSREIHARIDTKFAKLEAVIRDADERIDRLSRLTRARSGSPTCDVTLPDEGPAGPTAEAPTALVADPHDAIYSLAEDGLSALQIAEKTGRPTGEVELILALRRTRDSVAKPVLRA